MMKKITFQITFNSIRSRKDGSLGISIETPELSVEDKVEIMRLQNEVLDAVFTPVDMPDVPEYKIDKDLEQKSPSQRLRNSLYVLWEQGKKDVEFDQFYKEKMEFYINHVKKQLDPI